MRLYQCYRTSPGPVAFQAIRARRRARPRAIGLLRGEEVPMFSQLILAVHSTPETSIAFEDEHENEDDFSTFGILGLKRHTRRDGFGLAVNTAAPLCVEKLIECNRLLFNEPGRQQRARE